VKKVGEGKGLKQDNDVFSKKSAQAHRWAGPQRSVVAALSRLEDRIRALPVEKRIHALVVPTMRRRLHFRALGLPCRVLVSDPRSPRNCGRR
jgi:hypothetical protein